MNKSLYLYGIAALSVMIAVPAVSHSQTLMDTGAATSIGSSLESGPGTPGVGTIRERINANIKARDTNIKNNQSVRNDTLENRVGLMASTTTQRPPLGKPLPTSGHVNPAPGQASTTFRQVSNGERGIGNGQGGAGRPFNASTTDRINEGTKNLLKVRKDIFDQQKNHLISQLNQALNNLNQVRGRTADRITKAEASGKNMTNAKALLVTADAKLAAAKTAIDALTNLKPINATTTDSVVISTSDASTTANPPIIDLGKPRQIGAIAIKAVGDAQKALNAVVVAIAHSMGFKVSLDGTIIATSTATSTVPVTSTTTP